MPNLELDQLINAPDSTSSARSVKAISYRVEGDNLVLTTTYRTKVALFLPSQQMVDDDPTLLDEDEYFFFTEDQYNGYLEDEGYTEDDFQEHFGVLYTVVQEKALVREIAERAYAEKTSYPFKTFGPNLSEILFSKFPAIESVRYNSYLFSDADEDILRWAKQDGLNENSVKALKATLDDNRASAEAIIELLKKQEPTEVSFFLAKTGNSVKYYDKEGDSVSTDILKSVLELPGMKKVKDTIERGVDWGTFYDAKEMYLYTTFDGKFYDHRSAIFVSPNDLSLFLSGFADHPGIQPFTYLCSEEGKASADAIKKVLPDPKKVFSDLVDEASKDFSLEIRTDNDKPHGAYFVKEGKELGFSPMAELLNNKQVLHVCNPYPSPAAKDDGVLHYECYTEFVRKGDTYDTKRGEEGFTEKEEDNVKYYPDIRTDIYIKNNQIVDVVRFEGQFKGPASAGSYYGTSSDVLDVPNQRFSNYRRASNAGNLFPVRPIRDAVRAAVVFRWCETMRERLNGVS